MFTLSLQNIGNVNNENIYQKKYSCQWTFIIIYHIQYDMKRFDQFRLRCFNTFDFIILLVGIESHPLGINRAPMHFSTLRVESCGHSSSALTASTCPLTLPYPICPPVIAFSVMRWMVLTDPHSLMPLNRGIPYFPSQMRNIIVKCLMTVNLPNASMQSSW